MNKEKKGVRGACFDAVHLYGNEGIPDKTPFSRLMCEALSFDCPRCLLDIGCGSGIVGLYALLNGSGFVYFNDLQKDAIRLTQRNLQRHRIPESAYRLLNTPFQDIELSQYQIDAIFFNPPQLPTDLVPIDTYRDGRERIFRDGGADGRHLIDQFTEWLASCLHRQTRAYLGISSVLLPDNILKDAGDRGLTVVKKCAAIVPLRQIFYPAVGKMSEDERQRREISKKNGEWNKKIYVIEFRRNAG
ncbi:Methyltransferase small domain-containing protein [Candidatus Electronema halotolerans]